ncbi:hypothetical protein FKR81_18525 [Lentzea tibetensis]|uniref:Tetratricopeptide repeat protein n=1 Tax=Lentzea tibetensis TaxID=2591470 RepID=A0A563ESE1_9PSEU|nr:hypothetical protein [Lentzea tibetensis]TWP50617.1 hypothetical protein FKR81_18525 [Lentzea tibetensis]
MRHRFIWVLVVVASLVAAVGAALTKLPVPAVISSVVVAVGAIVAGVSTTRAAAVLKSRDDRQDTHRAVLRFDHRGRLPLVRDLGDPVQLGVHPAALVESLERVPTFVRRDVMDELTSLITRDGFVLLVGESTAGKSRAAYECVRSLFPDHRLVEPCVRAGASAAVETMLSTSRAVLWLDDIERFLGEDGFTGAGISSVLGAGHSIVATMRSEEYSYFCGGATTAADATRSWETIRQGWEVLRLATRIDLPRSWSTEEVRRAEELKSRDSRVEEALEHVDQFGVAEYLAAGPQLLAAWRDAWAPGAHPRAAALVLASVDARRAGMHRPLPLDVLVAAHESYLQRRGGLRLRPESIDEAVAWATSPLRATSSLLLPDDNGGYLAFDYLIDAVERKTIPADAFEAFIAGARVDELEDIGRLAWTWGRLDQAELAFERASESHPGTRFDRGYVIRERDGQVAHLEFLHRTADELEARLGRDHEETIEARFGVAWECGEGINVRKSLRALQALYGEAAPVLGRRHRTMLLIQRGIAHWLGQAGESREAARMYLQLIEDCLDNLDVNDWLTYSMMFGYVDAVAVCTTPARAVELLDEVEGWLVERRAPADTRLTLRYTRARQLEGAREYDRAIAEYEDLVSYQRRTAGRFSSHAVSVELSLADCIGESGQFERALRRYNDLLDEYQQAGDPQDLYVFILRRAIAHWTGRCGNEREAVRLLMELREERNQQYALGMDCRRRYWEATALMRAGCLDEAQVKLRELAEDCLIVFGSRYVDDIGVKRALEECRRLRAGSTSAGTASGRGAC